MYHRLHAVIVCDAVVERTRIALLKVRAPATADQERVAGEEAIAPQKATAAGCVAWCGDDCQRFAAEPDDDAVVEQSVESIRTAMQAYASLRPRFLLQCICAGDVIGVDMGFEDVSQLETA